jgi:hypothetical protein
MIVSICMRESGWWEVWLSLPRAAGDEPDGDSPDGPEDFTMRCMLRTRNREDALDLVAGVLAIWR